MKGYWISWMLIFIVLMGTGVSHSFADGQDLFASGDYAGATAALEQDLLTVQGANQAPVLNNIGTCYVAEGDLEKAKDYYSQAVTADPEYGRGYINLGVVLEKLGQPDEALLNYDKVSDSDPAIYAEAMVKKGTLLAGLGKTDEALAAFHAGESGAQGPVIVDLYTGIGAVEFLLKNTEAAEQAFMKATDADPNGAALAWTNLGVLRISQGKYTEAKSAFETAVDQDPGKKTNARQYLEKLDQMTQSGSKNKTDVQ